MSILQVFNSYWLNFPQMQNARSAGERGRKTIYFSNRLCRNISRTVLMNCSGNARHAWARFSGVNQLKCNSPGFSCNHTHFNCLVLIPELTRNWSTGLEPLRILPPWLPVTSIPHCKLQHDEDICQELFTAMECFYYTFINAHQASKINFKVRLLQLRRKILAFLEHLLTSSN